jgi:hypothetical protein
MGSPPFAPVDSVREERAGSTPPSGSGMALPDGSDP